MSTPQPVLMRHDDIVDIKRAADHAGRSDKTLRRWFKEYGIGRQVTSGSPIEISLPALEMIVHGDMEALELLRQGQRSAPEVRRYLDFLGLPV